ncbi:protein-L-isoaspartate(D-aspartate) O-methyltransferase [Herminiimonas fonticola]|uniref:Protein-L-isoaspartate O-methyltransferase n=1 Tax=Herminiimonas fonticola TaxID=303380 RepID=A0A4R6G6I3_9BURK|nr:protein-L-isoaspartate(D-aspartate) O-methyltransferase [Herminiimonas fonticola]RBA24107.1 pimt: protein-L-isoaspartate O-methyltransferase [Herminiimonas fonticola]TDN90107.1 protein-L-isoaspartate(D-aspartate) O-methyltransferase [Herminiimonas fonticola]
MTDKTKRFPLSLSSIAEKAPRNGTRSEPHRSTSSKTATPQTATLNASRHAVGSPARIASIPAASQGQTASSHKAVTHAPAAGNRSTPLVSDAIRKAMTARVAKQGVKDSKVLAAMEAVPRHLFMEPALASQAYIDASLPIGYHQTISQPYIVARMIEVMRNNNAGGVLNRVLEIGTGCGYQAAVLSLVAKEVYSIERIKGLHELAKTNLRPMRVANIRLHYGDGMLGLPQAAPFDGIILAAAGMEVPQALLEQMTIGGRLVAPVGDRHQVLQLIERVSKFEWKSSTLEDCHFVPLRPGTVT